MGTVLELCTCHASETVIPNYKSLIDNEDNALNNNKNEENNSVKYCKIKDWRANKTMEYRKMKGDY